MHFARNLARGANSNMFLVAKEVKKKKTIMDFSQETVKVL